jgi:hypothetical protein
MPPDELADLLSVLLATLVLSLDEEGALVLPDAMEPGDDFDSDEDALLEGGAMLDDPAGGVEPGVAELVLFALVRVSHAVNAMPASRAGSRKANALREVFICVPHLKLMTGDGRCHLRPSFVFPGARCRCAAPV